MTYKKLILLFVTVLLQCLVSENAFSQEKELIKLTPTDRMVDSLVIEGPQVVWKAVVDKEFSSGFSSPLISLKDMIFFDLKGKKDDFFNGYICAINSDRGTVEWVNNIGSGYARPAVDEDTNTLFVSSHEGVFYAFDIHSGEEIWNKKVENWNAEDRNISSVTGDQNVYFGYGTGYIYAFDKKTGEEQWRYDVEGVIYADPLVIDKNFYCATSDGRVFCLKKEDGTLIWEASIQPDIYFLNLLHEENQIIFVWCKEDVFKAPEERVLYFTAFDMYTGVLTWKTMFDSSEVASWPVKAFATIFQSRGQTVHALNCLNGQQKWKYESNNPFFPALTVHEDLLFAGHGAEFGYEGEKPNLIYAFDCKSGEIVWEYETPSGITHPIEIDNNVLCASSTDDISDAPRRIVFFLDPQTGEPKGKIATKKQEKVTDYTLEEGNVMFISVVDNEGNSAVYKLELRL